MSSHAKRRGNRRSKVQVENDTIAIVERMQVYYESAKDAANALGIPVRRAQRLARKGLLRVLSAASAEKIKAIATADSNPNPILQGQFELPELVPPQVDQPIIQTSEPKSSTKFVADQPVAEPDDDPWPWGHLMSHREFLQKPPHRQKQLVAQWEENTILGGKHSITLRGGIKNRNCFRGCPPYECLCEDNL
jgi:hypothetical protein